MAEERTGSSWVRWGPGQLLSLAGLVFVVLKLLVVSKFSHATAMALATSAGPGQVLLATILLGYPLLLTALAAGALTQILVELAARRAQGGAPDEGGREVARRPAWRTWPLILISLVALAFLDLIIAGFLLAIFLYFLLPVLFPGLRPQAIPGAAELARGRASGLADEARALRFYQELEAEQDPGRKAKIQAELDRLGLEAARALELWVAVEQDPGRRARIQAELDRLRERQRRRTMWFAHTRLLTWAPPAVVFLVLTFSPQMWLPPEIVQVEDHRIVAYVVSTEGRWTTLLREKDRTILRTKSDLVSGRQICELRSILRSRSLVQQIARADTVAPPPCFP